jgi:hypothetical protein
MCAPREDYRFSCTDDSIQGAKFNEINETSLAVHTVTLISNIIEVQQQRERKGRPLDPQLNAELEKLLKYGNFLLLSPTSALTVIRTFHRVEKFLEEQSKRSRISKIITFRTDADKVNIQRETLSHALLEFQVKLVVVGDPFREANICDGVVSQSLSNSSCRAASLTMLASHRSTGVYGTSTRI